MSSLAQWPETLPQYPIRDGYEKTVREPVDSFEVDQGPPQQRLRSISDVEIYTMRIWVDSKEQLVAFRNFYKTTIRKVRPFLWIEHPTDEPMVYQFDNENPPRERPLGASEWYIDMVLFGLPDQVPEE